MAQSATSNPEDDLTVREAIEEYLDDKSIDSEPGTIRSHRHRLMTFAEWGEEHGVRKLSDIQPTHFRRFKKWKYQEVKKITLKTYMDTLRVFVRWCEDYNYLEKGLSESVVSPETTTHDEVDLEAIEIPRAQRIRDYLRTYEYASREHIVFELIWHSTLRNCTVHSLDVSDFDRDAQLLTIRHRPEEGTRLKKQYDSERNINLNDDVAQIVADWIDNKRPDVTDEYGREPLIAWESGRPPRQSIAKDIYRVTTPGYVGDDCSCEGECPVTSANNAHECEDSVSPKRVRKASITYHLDMGWPRDVVADRADNSPDVIDKHYDTADEDEKAERRRKFMEALEDDEEDAEDEDGGIGD